MGTEYPKYSLIRGLESSRQGLPAIRIGAERTSGGAKMRQYSVVMRAATLGMAGPRVRAGFRRSQTSETAMLR